LGLNTERTEASLQKKYPNENSYWIGLPVKSLLTPYTEIRSILAQLSPAPGSTIVDLGAGYARMAFVIGRHYPSVRFIGYEYISERVQEARLRLQASGFNNTKLVIADLESPEFNPEPADYYFLYDFSNRRSIEKVLGDLKRIAKTRSITVIGRGRSSRDIIEHEHPWLSSVHSPRHFSHYSIYQS
jgi:ubiquinone/menaquinone biosynthesis C-methylase UbiE